MNKNLHDIDDLFKNAIDGHAEEVPPDVWKNIDHSLDKKQAALYKRKYFTVRAAAILLLLIGGATIAAILHYRSSGVQSKDETIITKTGGNELKKGQSKTIKDLGVKQSREDEKPTVFNDATSNKTSGNRLVIKKEYQNSESATYSAEKNGEISIGATGDKINKQKPGVRLKQINGASTLKLVHQRKSSNETNHITASEIKAEMADNLTRTTYIDASILNVNKFEIKNSLPIANAVSSIVPDFSSSSASTKSARSKNSLGSWSVSPMYAQNMNLNTLKDDEQFRDPRNNSREAKRTEQETKSFTAGLGVQKEFGGNFVLQTGLQYFSSQTTIKPKMIFAEPDGQGGVRYRFNCSSGNSYIPTKNGTPPAVGDSIKTNSSKTSLSYLQIPLLVSYKINLSRFSILPSAGIQSNFLLSSKLTSSLARPSGNEEVSGSIDGLRPVYFSGVLQPQLNYKLNDRVSFDLNPNINFSLSPINKETAVKTYQNMFSLGAGLRIKL